MESTFSYGGVGDWHDSAWVCSDGGDVALHVVDSGVGGNNDDSRCLVR